MDIDELLNRWRQWRQRTARRRLDAPVVIEHEYRGKQAGHPSTYAFVRFDCVPAAQLAFAMQASWPAHLPADYCRLLENAMSAAIIDALVAADWPHLGCAIVCTEVKWDDITSSEQAFYRATHTAMTALRQQHAWSPVANER